MENLKPDGVRPLSTQRGLTPLTADRILDCYGLLCPMPVRKTAEVLEEMPPGQVLQVIATDDWFGPDLEAWLKGRPHELLSIQSANQETHAYLKKCRVFLRSP